MAPKSVTFRRHDHLVSVLFGDLLSHSYNITFSMFLYLVLIPFCRKCGWLCIFHEEFCEKDKFAYHIVDILRNLLFFMVYLLWTVFRPIVTLRSGGTSIFA